MAGRLSAREQVFGSHSNDDDEDPEQRRPSEHRHRGLRSARREHEFEERDGIAQTCLEGPERAVAASDDERDALDGQEADARPQAPVAATRERAGPDVAEGRDAHDRPDPMRDPERLRLGSEVFPAHRSMLRRHLSPHCAPPMFAPAAWPGQVPRWVLFVRDERRSHWKPETQGTRRRPTPWTGGEGGIRTHGPCSQRFSSTAPASGASAVYQEFSQMGSPRVADRVHPPRLPPAATRRLGASPALRHQRRVAAVHQVHPPPRDGDRRAVERFAQVVRVGEPRAGSAGAIDPGGTMDAYGGS